MQAEIAGAAETGLHMPDKPGVEATHPDLPPNVVEALARLDKLEVQVEQMRRCAEEMRTKVAEALSRW